MVAAPPHQAPGNRRSVSYGSHGEGRGLCRAGDVDDVSRQAAEERNGELYGLSTW